VQCKSPNLPCTTYMCTPNRESFPENSKKFGHVTVLSEPNGKASHICSRAKARIEWPKEVFGAANEGLAQCELFQQQFSMQLTWSLANQ
jgi:hypothetical protein